MSGAFTVGSTLLNMASARSQAKAEARAAAYNEQQAKLEAESRYNKAAVDAGATAEDARRAIGTAEVAAGASGFTVGGSAVDVIADLARQGSANVRTVLWQGELARQGLLQEAKIQNLQGKAAVKRGVYGQAGALLNGGHQLLSSFSFGGGAKAAPAGGSANAH
jgi:hypothetical protein